MRTLFLTALLLPLLAHSQKNWLLGFEINPSYYVYQNATDQNAPPTDVIVIYPDIAKLPKSWSIGGRAQYDFNRHLSFVTGLRYNWSKQDYTFNRGDDVSYKLFIENHYLQAPVGIGLSTDKRKDSRFYFNVGLAPSINIGQFRFEDYMIESQIRDYSFHSIIRSSRNHWSQEVNILENGERIKIVNTYESGDYLNKILTLFAFGELGMQTALSDVTTFYIAANTFFTITEPEDRRTFYQESNYINEHGFNFNGIENRAKSRFLHVGITFGWMFELDGRR